jgi:hypothetical protein
LLKQGLIGRGKSKKLKGIRVSEGGGVQTFLGGEESLLELLLFVSLIEILVDALICDGTKFLQ